MGVGSTMTHLLQLVQTCLTGHFVSNMCSRVPGPLCQGVAKDAVSDAADTGEGYVHVHAGVHGEAGGVATSDLLPAQADWRNPMMRVVVAESTM